MEAAEEEETETLRRIEKKDKYPSTRLYDGRINKKNRRLLVNQKLSSFF